MKSPSHFKKDYYGGALMVLIGLAAIYASVQYRLGTLAHMGPGFFPCAVGALLVVTGVLIAASARGQTAPPGPAIGHAHGMPDLRGALCIILGVLAFLLLGEYLGLLPATFAIVFISALGDRSNTWLQALLLSLAMMAVATVVFWWALQLQLPLWKWGA
ncbi:tripartite tricarboxylate transporter TctB family protein [Xylophilus sp. ASV27]|uniref:tripartite tricarboxylate transporter TctB family protein n=1 Tax=Xylophilus sp. ASV27 TaxID=2795129 RepID=UPI001E395BA2|nr:tripartite tricarboxylate transporter TctB family protein [Xylophilus sp. ASV27]